MVVSSKHSSVDNDDGDHVELPPDEFGDDDLVFVAAVGDLLRQGTRENMGVLVTYIHNEAKLLPYLI